MSSCPTTYAHNPHTYICPSSIFALPLSNHADGAPSVSACEPGHAPKGGVPEHQVRSCVACVCVAPRVSNIGRGAQERGARNRIRERERESAALPRHKMGKTSRRSCGRRARWCRPSLQSTRACAPTRPPTAVATAARPLPNPHLLTSPPLLLLANPTHQPLHRVPRVPQILATIAEAGARRGDLWRHRCRNDLRLLPDA